MFCLYSQMIKCDGPPLPVHFLLCIYSHRLEHRLRVEQQGNIKSYASDSELLNLVQSECQSECPSDLRQDTYSPFPVIVSGTLTLSNWIWPVLGRNAPLRLKCTCVSLLQYVPIIHFTISQPHRVTLHLLKIMLFSHLCKKRSCFFLSKMFHGSDLCLVFFSVLFVLAGVSLCVLIQPYC